MGSIILQPELSLSLVSAPAAVANTSQKVLLVGQGTGGTFVGGVLNENIGNDTGVNNAKFGRRSNMAAMLRAFKSLNQEVQVDAIALADTGTDRTFTVVATGTATVAGVFTIEVGGSNYINTVAIPNTTTAAAAIALIEAAIDLDLDAPFIASSVTTTLTLTSDNAGLVANSLGVSISFDTPGITYTFQQTAAGATDPTLTNVLDVVGDRRYQTIVWPYADVTEVLRILDARWNISSSILDGVAINVAVDTYANLLTLATGVNYNSQSLVVFGDELTTHTGAATSPAHYGPAMNFASYEKAARFAAIRSLRLTDGASISQFMTTNASLDQIGGAALASAPYFNTPLPGFPIIPSNRGFNNTEIEALTAAGISVMGVNAAGDQAILGEVVTTYLTDSASNPDVTFTFLNYVDTSSAIREYFYNNYRARFAQSRLTTGTIVRGRDMVNASVVQAFTEGLYQDLASPSFVLVQDGEAAIKFFKTNLLIILNLATGQVTVQMQVPIVTQLRIIIATIQIAFSTTA